MSKRANEEQAEPRCPILPDDSPPTASGQPVFLNGPFAVGDNTSLQCAVWTVPITPANGQTFTAYQLTIHGSWRNPEGKWETIKSFQCSHLQVLIDALQECRDWVLAHRSAETRLAPK